MVAYSLTNVAIWSIYRLGVHLHTKLYLMYTHHTVLIGAHHITPEVMTTLWNLLNTGLIAIDASIQLQNTRVNYITARQPILISLVYSLQIFLKDFETHAWVTVQ